MSEKYDPPIKVSIPIPSHIPQARGIHATSGYGGNLRVRCTNDEYDLAQEEAKRLGLTLAGFCRWSIIHVAEALNRHRNEQSASDNAEAESLKD